ncbi:MAG: pyridoxal 5'-phosphate synthase lyase subunit PdxS [Planctomycetota bacterium]|nr:pyridoxal 5'-phosphate synthase lyase subunit PdxS [Planctomycetota bacterium]
MSISPAIPGFTSEEVRSKIGFCEQLKGGVIMDVVNSEQAAIAEEAGAVAVMALERVPSDIRSDGGVARASDPEMIQAIQKVTSIPVMAKVRIGHFVEAQILEALEVDCIDESEVLTPADEEFHVDKRVFKTPFVCGCRNLGEALRRVHEGAALIRTKGEPGTGNVVEAVRHMRSVVTEIQALRGQDEKILAKKAVEYRVPFELVAWVSEAQRLPVPNFSAGGIATPADAALMMQLGAESVFVGSGIFKADDPASRAKAIVRAATNYQDPKVLSEISTGLGAAMRGLEVTNMPAEERMATRGW